MLFLGVPGDMYSARERKQHILLTSCKYGKYVNITFYSQKSSKCYYKLSYIAAISGHTQLFNSFPGYLVPD